MGVSLVFLAVAGLYPGALRPLNRFWARFGRLLQSIVSPVVLGLLFFLVITPIGLLVRLRGRSWIKLTFDSETLTYWIIRNPPGPAPDTMKHQF